MEKEYIIRRTGGPREAEITENGRFVGQLEEDNDKTAILRTKDGSGRVFELNPRVDGVISTFSSTIYDSESLVLKIKSGLFSHNGNVYMFKGLPEGVAMIGHLSGVKVISRLDRFPYQDLDQVDRETRERLSRYRGIEVGRISGLGSRGHKVALHDDLFDIGLPLSAASYLLYSTG